MRLDEMSAAGKQLFDRYLDAGTWAVEAIEQEANTNISVFEHHEYRILMADQSPDALFERHSELCKVFANPKRLKILDLLKGGTYSVTEISEETGIPQPTVSQHLRKMRDQGVVEKEDAGAKNYYRIADERIVEGMETMRAVLLDQMGEEANPDVPDAP